MLDEANVQLTLVKIENKAIEEFLAKIDQEVSFSMQNWRIIYQVL
jgi:hypothetical protein